MKPDFNSLPAILQERLLWDMELDYNADETDSKAEIIDNIICGAKCHRNTSIIATYYDALSSEALLVRTTQERNRLSMQLFAMNKLVDELS